MWFQAEKDGPSKIYSYKPEDFDDLCLRAEKRMGFVATGESETRFQVALKRAKDKK